MRCEGYEGKIQPWVSNSDAAVGRNGTNGNEGITVNHQEIGPAKKLSLGCIIRLRLKGKGKGVEENRPSHNRP